MPIVTNFTAVGLFLDAAGDAIGNMDFVMRRMQRAGFPAHIKNAKVLY